MTRRPTSVEPVNATLRTDGCELSAAPVCPSPVITLSTPGGSPASSASSASRSALSGVCSAGLSTIVQPAASAGADLPGGHQQRVVPGDDLGADADRLADRERQEAPVGRMHLAAQLGRPAGVVGEDARGAADVPAGLDQRLAVVERLEPGELVGVLLEQRRHRAR